MKIKSIFLAIMSAAVMLGFTASNAAAQGKSGGNGKVVILLAHPNIEKSNANNAMVKAVEKITNAEVINIYSAPFTAEYYRPKIETAQAVVFQFPFYWASAPSQLKKWSDEIFSTFGLMIKGKKLMVATTTGSEYGAYRSGGRNKFTMDELLRPYEMHANHSGMVWQTPFVIYGTATPDAAKNIAAGAKEYKKIIEELAK